jgi:hypothetical protein
MAPVLSQADEKTCTMPNPFFKKRGKRTSLILLDVLLLDLLAGVAAEHVLRLSTIAAPTLL